jgi:methanogenic corrinoid protein MtbC1
MIADTRSSDGVETFLQRAVDGDARVATRLALDMLDRGVSGDDLIVNLLGAAQHQVGERWFSNEWTVADEHIVSGVVQQALDAVASAVDPPPAQGLVVVACAEGDWHSLPAQMFAELLRSRGFNVTFLGASTPVEHTARLLSRQAPDALAISCNVPLYFGGVARLADAARDRGIPVLAGGRALGHCPARAIRLGADAWASGIDDAVSVLRSWPHDKPSIEFEPSAPDRGIAELDLDAHQVAAEAFDALAAVYPSMSSYTGTQLTRTREDLAFITRFVAAASLVDDPTVLTDFLDWLMTLLAMRDVPPSAIYAGLSALAPIISRIHPPSGELTRDALGLLTG